MKKKFQPHTEITPKQIKAAQRNLAKCWIKINRKCMPPNGVMVMIRVRLCKNNNLTYLGRFRYGVGQPSTVSFGGTNYSTGPIPKSAWKAQGIVAWMPVPI